jgi:drug/metabolite transporter (DMT)-like permease
MSPSPAQAADGSAVARGIGLYTLAIFLLSVMDAMIKWLSDGFPTSQIIFFRTTFGLLPLVVALRGAGGLGALATRRLPMHIARGLIGAAAAFTFFYAFKVMPLADAYAIAFASPLFITALSVPMLAEHVGVRRWIAVAVGFLGILVMLRPGASDLAGLLSLGALAALAGTFFYAVAVLLIRKMSSTETNAAIILYGSLVGILASGLVMIPDFVEPNGPDLALLIATGVLGGCGTLAMTEAFRIAPAAVIAPFEYTAMVWAVVLGYWLWGDLPDAFIIAGSAIVVASGLYIFRRETREAARPAAAKPTELP